MNYLTEQSTLGERLVYALDKINMSQATLSKLTGVSQPAISKICSGQIKRSSYSSDFAKAMNISPDWLIYGIGEMGFTAEQTSKASYDLLRKLSGDDIDESPTIRVPRLEVTASMGPGAAMPEYDVIAEEIVLRRDWVSRNLSITNISNLAMISGSGDSMTPTFNDGDTLIVDTGINDVSADAVYVLTINDQLYIKRLQRRPDGSILMISDNKQYEPYTITDGEKEKFQVLGRVKLAWVSKKI